MTNISPLLLLFTIVSIGSGILFSVMTESLYRWIKKRRSFKMMPQVSQEALLSPNETKQKETNSWKQRLHYAGIQDHHIPLIVSLFIVADLLLGTIFYLFISTPIQFFVSTVLTLFLFREILNYIALQRRKTFNKQLTIMISLLVKMIKNGIGFDQALKEAILANSNPFFKKTMNQFLSQKQQIGEERAFENLIDTIDSKELKIFALAVKIGKQSGGSLSSTLEKLESSLIAQEKLQRHIETKTRETKIGSYLIVFLIIAIFIVLDITFNGNVSKYFFHTQKGKIAITIIGLWLLFGLYINNIITRIK